MTPDMTRAEIGTLIKYDQYAPAVEVITQLLRQLDAAEAKIIEEQSLFSRMAEMCDHVQGKLDAETARADAAAGQMRQAMAAYTLAFNEPDRDVESDEDCRRQTASWFAHWMVNNYPTAHEGEAHSGDCTKQSWTCMRCCADEAFADVDAALTEWKARALPLHEEPNNDAG